jgi:hypothetical protein
MQPPLNHFTSPDFWSLYKRLPADVQRTADKYFARLKSDPGHPSLHLKKIGEIWSGWIPLSCSRHGRAKRGEEYPLDLDWVTRRVRPFHQTPVREQHALGFSGSSVEDSKMGH